MSICLSNASADKALEYMERNNMRLEPVSSSVLTTFEATSDAISEVSGPLEKILGEHVPDLELLVGSYALRHAAKDLTVHAWTSELPEASLAKVCDGLYVSRPAFCLLQQARELHLVNLCQMLGRYLAVASPVGGRSSSQLHERDPLVNEEDLMRYLSEFYRTKGVAALREALRWVAPGAASPQETNLQLLMTLPPCYNGFGLRKPTMNYEIAVTGEARKLTTKERFAIDLYWEDEHLGLEYQGAYHESTIGEDYERFYALDAMGERVLYIAKEQMEDASQMDYVARIVARRLGKKVQRDNWPPEDGLQDLLDILAGKRIPSQKEGQWRCARKGAREDEVGSWVA